MAFAYSEITGDKLNIIAKIQASRGLNKKINEFREMSGNEIIEIGLSLKNIFKKIYDNELFCFLTDQSANPDYSVYINFFGMEVPAFSGPAKLAERLKPVLLLAYGKRHKDYSYVMRFEKINYDDINIKSDESIKILTQRIQNKFEELIRKDPGQWLWFHKRFKHRRFKL